MYEEMTLKRDLLAEGLFRTAYGVDGPFQDGETVYRTFVLLAEAIRRMGGSPDVILRQRNQAIRGLATSIMNSVDRLGADTRLGDPEFPHLLAGMDELLRKLIT